MIKHEHLGRIGRTQADTGRPERTMSWLAFWNEPNQIYVSNRHRDAHYDVLFQRIKPFLTGDRHQVLLDWGCGDALASERLATLCRSVLLYDAAPTTRARLLNRHRGNDKIEVLDEAGLAALPLGTIDVIVVNSVIQYLDRDQLHEVLGKFGPLLSSAGILLLGDVIDPNISMKADILNLLCFAWQKGFLVASVLGLMRTFASRYRRLRRELGFARYSRDEICKILADHGLAADPLSVNIAPSRYRRSYIARKVV